MAPLPGHGKGEVEADGLVWVAREYRVSGLPPNERRKGHRARPSSRRLDRRAVCRGNSSAQAARKNSEHTWSAINLAGLKRLPPRADAWIRCGFCRLATGPAPVCRQESLSRLRITDQRLSYDEWHRTAIRRMMRRRPVWSLDIARREAAVQPRENPAIVKGYLCPQEVFVILWHEMRSPYCQEDRRFLAASLLHLVHSSRWQSGHARQSSVCQPARSLRQGPRLSTKAIRLA